MKINNFQGELTDISAKKEPLMLSCCEGFGFLLARRAVVLETLLELIFERQPVFGFVVSKGRGLEGPKCAWTGFVEA